MDHRKGIRLCLAALVAVSGLVVAFFLIRPPFYHRERMDDQPFPMGTAWIWERDDLGRFALLPVFVDRDLQTARVGIAILIGVGAFLALRRVEALPPLSAEDRAQSRVAIAKALRMGGTVAGVDAGFVVVVFLNALAESNKRAARHLDTAADFPPNRCMRACVCLAVAAMSLALGGMCPAQLPSSHSLSMDVIVTATGGATKSSNSLKIDLGGEPLGNGWETAQVNEYAQNRSKESGISLTVHARNLGRAPDNAKLEWYFVGKSVENRGRTYIFESGSKEITIGPGKFTTYLLRSAPLKSTVEKQLITTDAVDPITRRPVGPTASVVKSGESLAGWIVRLTSDGKLYQIRASSPSLESMGRNDAQLAAFPRASR